MAPPTTTADLRSALAQSGLLTHDQLEPYFREDGDPAAVLDRLVADRLLTPFQAKQIQKGRIDGFFLSDKYKILDLVGSGGMGKVYLCEHLLLHRLVAVKILQPPSDPGTDSGRSFERFYREARAVAALNDPNIIRVFDVDRVGANPFMVMEYADGTNLHQVVTDHGALNPIRAAEYIRQAALGLQHAHEQGLVHRDVKPGNLILCRDGTVKLLDLGLARFTHDPHRNASITDRYDKHLVIGTVDFMAPEQAFETNAVDVRSDIYGLGCTLYFLLTRLVPFPDRSAPEKMYAHKTRAPAPVSELAPRVPAGLMAILERMMAKDPGDRFQKPIEVVEALAAEITDDVPPPPTREMPAHPIDFYRIGLTPVAGSGVSPTPHPESQADTAISAKPQAGQAGWDLPGYHTPPPKTPPPRTGQDPSIVLATPPPASSRGSGTSPSRLRSARRYRRLVRLGELVLFVLAAGGVGWLASREWMHKGATTAPAAAPTAGPTFTGPVVRGAGVTFAEPVLKRWAAAYEEQRGVRIAYQAVGQEKAVQGMLDGVYPFATTVVPLDADRLAAATGDVLHIPLVVGTVAAAYNLPDVPGELQLTGPLLADMYLGKITHWNDELIKKANPGVTLPALKITVVYHQEPTGTSVLWNEFLEKLSPEWKNRPGGGWPAGEGAKANAGTAALVGRTPGAIGYVEPDFAQINKLRMAKVQNRSGQWVGPTPAGAAAALASVLPTVPADLRYSLTDAPGDESYPISGTVWAVLYAEKAGPDVAAFLRWAIGDGQGYLADAQFATLPPELVRRVYTRLDKIRAR